MADQNTTAPSLPIRRLQEATRQFGEETRQFGGAMETLSNYYDSLVRDMSLSYIPKPQQPKRDPSFLYFDDCSVKNTLRHSYHRTATWPKLERFELLLLNIQEELWIRTGLNFFAVKWDSKEEHYLIHLAYRNKSHRAKCPLFFSIVYDQDELTKTPMTKLIEGFYSYLQNEMEVYADRLLEKGVPAGRIIADGLSKHADMWEAYISGEEISKPDIPISNNTVAINNQSRDYSINYTPLFERF